MPQEVSREQIREAFHREGATGVPAMEFNWHRSIFYDAERGVDGADVIVHFHYPAAGCTERYWSTSFPAALVAALNKVFGKDVAEQTCRARRMNGFEIDSWWLRCFGLDNRYMDPMFPIDKLYAELDALLVNTNTMELGCFFQWVTSHPKDLAPFRTSLRISLRTLA